MILKATFGGGCFWCTEAVFQEVNGVHDVRSGYSGGHQQNPSYYDVCREITGHAEVIEITYDSDVISLQEIVIIHMTTHDPTTPNQQGADRGSQYRSIIFYRDEEEKQIISETINALQEHFKRTIVTEIKAFETFYPAEIEHQDYYASNSNAPYCHFVIDPKLKKLRELHPSKLKIAQNN